MTVDAMKFSAVANALGKVCADEGMTTPGFRAPPRKPGVTRTLRRVAKGAVVSVEIRDRSPRDVVKDMVDGTLAANGRDASDPVRRTLLLAAGAALAEPTANQEDP